MSSPFDKKGGTATATKARNGSKAPADLPDVTNIGEDSPVGNDPFAASDPSGISGVKISDFVGHLVLIHATETGRMVTSANKPGEDSEFVRADIIPLTVPDTFEGDECVAGERYDDVLLFQAALVREGKKALDKGIAWVIGRIEMGQAKKGKNAPYLLVPATDEDKALYQQWRAQQG